MQFSERENLLTCQIYCHLICHQLKWFFIGVLEDDRQFQAESHGSLESSQADRSSWMTVLTVTGFWNLLTSVLLTIKK